MSVHAKLEACPGEPVLTQPDKQATYVYPVSSLLPPKDLLFSSIRTGSTVNRDAVPHGRLSFPPSCSWSQSNVSFVSGLALSHLCPLPSACFLHRRLPRWSSRLSSSASSRLSSGQGETPPLARAHKTRSLGYRTNTAIPLTQLWLAGSVKRKRN
jgi:hypothetical protein